MSPVDRQTGEARNHEVEAVVRAFLGEERWATMTTERREQERERMHTALDAVRCAQGRDTDAPEDQRPPLESGAPDFPHGSNANWYRRARSPQGEDDA